MLDRLLEPRDAGVALGLAALLGLPPGGRRGVSFTRRRKSVLFILTAVLPEGLSVNEASLLLFSTIWSEAALPKKSWGEGGVKDSAGVYALELL